MDVFDIDELLGENPPPQPPPTPPPPPPPRLDEAHLRERINENLQIIEENIAAIQNEPITLPSSRLYKINASCC